MRNLTPTARLGLLESAGLIQLAAIQPELEYVFRHILIKDAAYASLVKGDRRRLHHLVAETLERQFQAAPTSASHPQHGELLPLMAVHFAEAGELARAVQYFTQAGDAAMRVYANLEAIQHYTRALDLAPRVPASAAALAHLYTRRGRAQEVTGQQPAAIANYLELEAIGREWGDPSLVLTALSLRATLLAIPSIVSDPAQARDLALAALPMSRELGDQPAEARFLWTLTLADIFLGQPGRAVAYGQEALALARALGLREQLGLILNDLGSAYLNSGNVPAAREAAEEARRLWQAEGNLPMLAESVSNLASSYFFSGEYGVALDLSRESQALGRQTGDAWGQSTSLMLQGFIFTEQGSVDDALKAANECLRLSAQSGFYFPQIMVRANLALVYSTLGLTQRGLDQAQQALAAADAQAPEQRTFVLAILALLCCDLGDFARSEAYLRETRAGLRPEDQLPFVPLLAAAAEGHLALALGDPERAITVCSQAAAAFAQTSPTVFRSDVMLPWARALHVLGRPAAAETVLTEVRGLVEAQQARRPLYLVLAALAQLAAERGDAAQARALRLEGRAVVDYITSHTSEAGLRDSFLQTPEVQALLRPD